MRSGVGALGDGDAGSGPHGAGCGRVMLMGRVHGTGVAPLGFTVGLTPRGAPPAASPPARLSVVPTVIRVPRHPRRRPKESSAVCDPAVFRTPVLSESSAVPAASSYHPPGRLRKIWTSRRHGRTSFLLEVLSFCVYTPSPGCSCPSGLGGEAGHGCGGCERHHTPRERRQHDATRQGHHD